ncbi:hypothetical protein EGW08_010073, partial [Elysia chlorotica]
MASGYEVNFNDKIDSRFLCPICLLVMREAVQTACGHRFCEGCLSRIPKRGPENELTCPVDKTPSRAKEIFPDVATRREILSLALTCNNSEEGCVWTGELRGLESHIASCDFQEIRCFKHCGARILRKHLDMHSGECPARVVFCRHCRTQVVFTALQAERYQVQEHVDHSAALRHHLSLAASVISSHSQTMHAMQRTIEQLKIKTDDLQPSVQLVQRRQEQISRELRDRNVTGRLQWKIKLSRYTRGRHVSYCSPTFYTGCPGYKVQLTLNMEGFREGREWFASLSLGLLPGEYDDSIVFPFNATCSVTLFDQSENMAARQNFEQQIVARQVPRNSRAGHSGPTCRRTINKFMARRNLIGPSSKYMRNGCLHLELTVLHSVFPAPDYVTTP